MCVCVCVCVCHLLHHANHQPPSPPRQPPTTLSTTAFTTTTSHHLLNHISPNKPKTNNIASPSSPKRRHLCASHGESALCTLHEAIGSGSLSLRTSACQDRCLHARPLCDRFTKRSDRDREGGRASGGLKVGDRRSNLISRTQYKGARSTKRGQSGEVEEPRGSLKPGACSRWRS